VGHADHQSLRLPGPEEAIEVARGLIDYGGDVYGTRAGKLVTAAANRLLK
jgi:hypothetical protein